MRIVLVNVSGRLSSDGSRLISALLKRAGHKVKLVFMARAEPLEYEGDELNHLDVVLKEADLVMVAVYSSYAYRAVQIGEYVHKKYPGMMVVWGGPHCIASPEVCLKYTDAVCFAEGDKAVIELTKRIETGSDVLSTPNMAFNLNGKQIINEVLPMFSDLDDLPYYDYDLQDHYLLDRQLIEMTKESLKNRLVSYPYKGAILYYMTSRGCPHKCAFCNNSQYFKLYGHNKMRFHSVERVVDELESLLNRLDFIEFIGFGDDDFFVHSTDQLVELADIYKRKIGLPFGVCVSANTYNSNKMKILLNAGLKAVQMGVESGSQRVINDIYRRNISVMKTRRVALQIAEYRKKYGLELLLDFIIDNPYESKDDIIQTYFYLLRIPADIRINLFFLVFFPGTPIYSMAIQDGIIEPHNARALRFYTRSKLRYQRNFETFLVLFIRFLGRNFRLGRYLPRSLLNRLGSRAVRKLAGLLPGSFYSYLAEKVQ